ncbi:RidA family protein [Janthinobacterium agaricidamnosum]|uniref:Ribonuclease UK114 domain protein n=1 Tax=Janthinobacterium agaricidamnosum NBRC 102515 = DSM 9628 TaxID=1349767 RepID=W0V3Z5_9BURK|nr:RidA family protein [Janthinobacterium agaricidamnosum]CDG83549.1 ribonuclease UK114 domain protein [Janthinobacterium agaricidamnosum NBRC 102515 = DSM 9628]
MSKLNKVVAGPVEFHATEGSPYPFSDAVRVGDTIYLSGQIGLGPDGLADGFEAQSRQMMDNVAATLKSMGLGMQHLVKCSVMIADMSKWSRFNDIYITYFEAGRYPARCAMGSNGLALGAELEIDCIAHAPQ